MHSNCLIGHKYLFPYGEALKGDEAGNQALDLQRMMKDRLSNGTDVKRVAAKLVEVINLNGRDFSHN